MKQSNILLFLFLLITLSSFAFASSHGTPASGGSSFDIGEFVSKIISVGQLTFLGSPDNQFVGFVRILMAVLVFSLIYLGLSMIPGMSRNIGITIAILLSILVSIFFPASILLAWGTAYASLFAFFIIFGPVIGLGAVLITTPTPNRGAALVKFATVIALWWVVAHIAEWAHLLGTQFGGVV
ncbi:hypothetical protein HY496_02840 [Candidatus Woesearchaeota archaeon]|nr:hypothetical protein [Candidatus Woesearchaeota archaeon]